jgi:predicted ribosomally synthesized peptide with SipW-like signal peptide
MKTKKILLTVAAMALVAVVAVSVTFAYLTDNAKVENTFTIGKVDITLDEAIVDEYGKEVTGEGAGRRTSNEYKLIPNHTYKKDPTIHVDSNSEKCWIFAKLENGLGTAATITPVTGWTLIDSANNIYAFDTIKNPGDNQVFFEEFKLSANADPETLKNKKIIITAYAIQSDGFNTAQAAWEAAGSSFTN